MKIKSRWTDAMVLGQQNDPNDIGLMKIIIAALFGAITIMWGFFAKVFLVLLNRNEQLREEKKNLECKVEELEEDDQK